MDKFRVIVISSVRPEPKSAGQAVLHRLLVNQPEIELEVYGDEPSRLTPSSALRRLIGKVAQTKWRSFAQDFWVLWGGRWIDPLLPQALAAPTRTVVVTVAHGDGFMAARRFAKRHGLPLVSFFQDWWPDIVEVHGLVRGLLERQFRRLAADSAAAICVSEGMRRALGTPRCEVVPDLPSARGSRTSEAKVSDGKLKLLYFGNLAEYGPMLGDALRVLEGNAHVDLVVRGARPKWSADFAQMMRKQEKWLEFAPRAELEAWLESADAFLVPMVFDPTMRRRMETSFPSKLIEFAQFGKPLVVWGPEYCSAVEWARRNHSALCVTDPDAVCLLAAAKRLADSPKEQKLLAAKASWAAQHEFSVSSIRKRTLEIFARAVCVHSGVVANDG